MNFSVPTALTCTPRREPLGIEEFVRLYEFVCLTGKNEGTALIHVAPQFGRKLDGRIETALSDLKRHSFIVTGRDD